MRTSPRDAKVSSDGVSRAMRGASLAAIGRFRATLRLKRISAAVPPRCKIAYLVLTIQVAGGLEQLVDGADVDVTFAIKREVAA